MTTETSLLLPLIPFIPLLAALFVALGETDDWRAPGGLRARHRPARSCSAASWSRSWSPPARAVSPLILTAWGGFLYADILSALLICCTFLVVAGVGIYSFAYLRHDVERGLVTEGGIAACTTSCCWSSRRS